MKGVKKRSSANEVNDYGKINAFLNIQNIKSFCFVKYIIST